MLSSLVIVLNVTFYLIDLNFKSKIKWRQTFIVCALKNLQFRSGDLRFESRFRFRFFSWNPNLDLNVSATDVVESYTEIVCWELERWQTHPEVEILTSRKLRVYSQTSSLSSALLWCSQWHFVVIIHFPWFSLQKPSCRFLQTSHASINLGKNSSYNIAFV